MEDLISQFENFQQSVKIVEKMLATCNDQMSTMENHILAMTSTDEEKEKVKQLIQSSKPQKSELLPPIQMERSISQNKSDEQVIQEAMALAQSRRKSVIVEPLNIQKNDITRRKRDIVAPPSPNIEKGKGIPKFIISNDENGLKASHSSDIKSSTSSDIKSTEKGIQNTPERSILTTSSVQSPSVTTAPNGLPFSGQGAERPAERSILQTSTSQPMSSNNQSQENSVATPTSVSKPPRMTMQIELPKPVAPFQIQSSSNGPPEMKQDGPSVVVNIPLPAPTPMPPTIQPAATPGPAPVPLNKGFDKRSNQNIGSETGWRRIFNSKLFRQPDMSNTTGVSMSMLKLSGDRSEALFHPQSLAIKVWNSLYFFLQIIMVLMIPACIAFEDSLGGTLYGFTIANCVLVVIDTLIKYNCGIMANQQVQMDGIRNHHFKNGSWVFDILTVVPWIYVVDSFTRPNTLDRSAARLLCMINASPILALMFRKGSCGYLSEKLTQWTRKNGVSSSLIDSIKVMILMWFYWHFNSCFTMVLQKIKISFTTSVYSSEWDHYSAAIFESSAEMLANGWGSANPATTQDRWLKVFNQIISATFLALFIGNISAFMIGLDSSGKRFNEILEEVNQYITYKGFGDNLRNRILQYYQFKYSGGKYFDENRIMDELNQPLRQYIALRECQDLIIKVPFFKDADKYFISQVVMILKVNHYLPGDYVIEEGTSGDHMYFIASGTVEAIVNGVSRAKLFPGLFFGEIALLFGRMKRTASIRAVTHCVLYSLSRQDLNSVLELNPVMADKMKQVAADRLAADAKAKNQPPPPPPQVEKTAEMSPQK